MKILIFGLTIFLLAIQVGFANSQNVIPQNDFENFTQNFTQQLNNKNFTLEDAKNLLYKKCKKAALYSTEKPQTYENIEMAANKLIQCANDIANVTVLMAEIEAASPVGELDVVFQKYCAKQPQAEQCLQEFNEQLLPCLTPAERAQNAIMMRILTSLLGFVCYKNGDQVALFISEQGPECLKDNEENISNCMNATFSSYLPNEGQLPPTDLPELVMGPEQCIDLHDFEECVLGYLEKCNEITPANIIESLFRYVKNETKCQEEIDKVIKFHPANVEQRNVAVGITLKITLYLAMFMVGLTVFLKHYF